MSYIKQFNWPWNKQKSMNNTGFKKNKTHKNIKDRLRFKKKKKYKLKIQKIQKANKMILNKSNTFCLTMINYFFFKA